LIRDISLKERIPVHPRDFSLQKRTDELGIGEVGHDATAVAAVGVNGCTGTFIWAGGLVFGAHTICGSEEDDMEALQDEVKEAGKENEVTSVAICYSEGVTDGLEDLKKGLEWTGHSPDITTYPYDEDVDTNSFTLTGTTASPGQVTVENHPIEAPGTPGRH